MKKLTVIAVLFFLLAVAAAPMPARAEEKPDPSAIAIAVDAVVIRPLGIVSIVAGSVVFVVALPFSIPTGSVGLTAKKLVVEPFKFTFVRPVGETRE